MKRPRRYPLFAALILGAIFWKIASRDSDQPAPAPEEQKPQAVLELPKRPRVARRIPRARPAPSRPTVEPRDAPVARAACQSEVLAVFSSGPDTCVRQVLGLREVFDRKIRWLKDAGVTLDLDRCVATDARGDTTDLDDLFASILEATSRMVAKRLSFTLEGDLAGEGFKRANAVGLCSILKSIDYWAEHPQEIPSPDHMADYLLFDIHEGRPKESFITATFFRTLSELEQMRRQSLSYNSEGSQQL